MKKRGLRVLTLFLAILLCFTFMPSTRVWAQTEEERLEEAQKKLKELEEEKKKIEEQKKNAKNELADLNYQKTSVKEQLDELTLALECAAAELDKLEKAIADNKNVRMLYLIPTFHNPAGICTSLEKRKRIYEIAFVNFE